MTLRNALNITSIILSMTVGGLAVPAHAAQDTQPATVELLSVQFETRSIAKMEGGDFHFKPGQPAPVHSHMAPAIGYIAKGKILYQVEGRAPVILNEGEAFYEPTDKRILRFDNASASEEAIFIDFSFQRKGDPFIVFETPPTEAIDRRGLPTVAMNGEDISKATVLAVDLGAGDQSIMDASGLLVGYVAEGVIELRNDGTTASRYVAGESFPLVGIIGEIVFANLSDDVRAKVITISGK